LNGWGDHATFEVPISSREVAVVEHRHGSVGHRNGGVFYYVPPEYPPACGAVRFIFEQGMGDPDRESGMWVALGFAWRLGYSIAIPLVVLLLVGRLLDKRFGTSPWLLITGLALSFITTNVLMFREAMRVMQQAERENDKAPNPKHQIPNNTK